MHSNRVGMGMMAVARVAVLAVAAPLSGHAQTAGASACPPAACTQEQHEVVRAEIEQLYGDVVLILSAHERPALRSDQSAWRSQSQVLCQKQAAEQTPQGAATDSYFYACQIAQSQQRRMQLRHWLMNGYSVD